MGSYCMDLSSLACFEIFYNPVFQKIQLDQLNFFLIQIRLNWN